jgi:hypothetical protein
MQQPIPKNEDDRVWALAEYDIDYSDVSSLLKDLVELAPKIAGTQISFVNLIDTYTQWSVANFGLPIEQMKSEDSVCQYTILNNDEFEVKSFSSDDRFKDKFYVVDNPNLEYYFGIPLATADGHNLGALYALQAAKKQIELLLKIKVGQEQKPIPKNKLLQIAGNLITNAIKFTDNNCKISVDLNIHSNPGTGQVLEFEVTDNGLGLAQNEIDDKLNGIKVSSNGTTGEKGYGFGLSLVKRLIDELNGTLVIESELGKVTHFKVSLPQ